MARFVGISTTRFRRVFSYTRGAKTDRAELTKVIGRLEPEDVLVVTRLDRLARSTCDLLNVIDAVTKRGASFRPLNSFRSLKDTWADTTSPDGRLMLTVLGSLAGFERELILARTGESRRRAKEPRVRFSAPARGSAAAAGSRRDASGRGQDL